MVVVVAETVAVAGASVTSTMDEVEATGMGGAMMVAATDRRGAWPVRRCRQTVFQCPSLPQCLHSCAACILLSRCCLEPQPLQRPLRALFQMA